MKPKAFEILREGEFSVDGRYLLPGSIRWPQSAPLPVMEAVTEDTPLIVVGEMFNFRRKGGRIYCDADVDGEAIGIDLKGMEIEIQGESDALIVTNGEIMGGVIMPAEHYVWRDK